MSREGMYVENHVLNLASIGERIRKFHRCGPLRNRPRVVVRLSFALGQRQVGLFFFDLSLMYFYHEGPGCFFAEAIGEATFRAQGCSGIGKEKCYDQRTSH